MPAQKLVVRNDFIDIRITDLRRSGSRPVDKVKIYYRIRGRNKWHRLAVITGPLCRNVEVTRDTFAVRWKGY